MSDIEDYAYSPYDDIDDLLYDADPAPELADDLAEHSIPSPVYQDEIAGYELQEYHSDWEYYSDDYMDDDPALLRTNPQDGGPTQKAVKRKKKDNIDVSKRGTKRKLSEKVDVEQSERELLTRCIKGTVWGKPRQQNPPSYNPGQGAKVALMKNWKEIFAITDDGWGRQTDRTDEDESWAKDMSLADMGLENMQGKPLEPDTERQTSDYERENEEEIEEDEDVNEHAEDETEEVDTIGLASNKKSEPPPGATETVPSHIGDENNEELPRKRRRVDSEGSVSQSKRSSLLSSIPNERPLTANTRGKMREVKPRESEAVKAQTPDVTKPDGRRKRKATEEAEEGGHDRSTASSRAKRVAVTNSRASQNGTSSTRQTRSSKK